MKYSIINGERSEPQLGLSGQCPVCGNITIAKCGEKKIWHWAHKGKRMCDHWWENETDWHRNWKDCFPSGSQEIIQHDKNGEKHIADVKTAAGYVLEFQHSFLDPDERRERNAFYQKLVWVVDGARRTLDKKQFFEMLDNSSCLCIEPFVRVAGGKCNLLNEWSGQDAIVFFDFGGEILHGLLPVFVGARTYLVEFPRHLFVRLHNQAAEQMEITFEDCMNKLCTFASEYRRNELYQIKHGVAYRIPDHTFSQQQLEIQKQTSNHLIKLHDRFKIVMKPYFGTQLEA